MSNRRNIYTVLSMALVMGVALSACAVTAEAPNASVGDGASLEATEALTTTPGGTKIACTMSGPTVTGRRWGFLAVDNDQSTCYRYADPARAFEAAPVSVAHCGELGHAINCTVVIDQ
jgi:hypothetical protein